MQCLYGPIKSVKFKEPHLRWAAHHKHKQNTRLHNVAKQTYETTLRIKIDLSFLCAVPADERLTTEQMILLRDTLSKTKEKLQRLTTDHRDLHGAVSKIGKTIDRNFVSDFSSTTRNDVLVEEQNIQLLNKVIAQHLQRNNLDDVAATLIKESKLPAEEVVSDPFSNLHRIWEAIYRGDLTEALEWASEHSAKLEARNSSLEFKLHRIAFLQVRFSSAFCHFVHEIIVVFLFFCRN